MISNKLLGATANIELQGQRYYLQKKIGEGCTSEVYKATNRNGSYACVKIIQPTFYNNKIGKQLIDNEILILQKVNHPNILKFHKKHQAQRLMIVTEYCSQGSLFDMLQKKKSLNEIQTQNIMKDIVKGCLYLNKKGILHRDLKPENIFLNKTSVKIADFGFAVEQENKQLIGFNVGSPLYMPYQSLSFRQFSNKSDIFAIGVIWYQLLTGHTPFQARQQNELKEKLKGNHIVKKEIGCNKQTLHLIMKCLSFKKQQRPTIEELNIGIQNILKKRKTNSLSFSEDVLTKNKIDGNKQNHSEKIELQKKKELFLKKTKQIDIKALGSKENIQQIKQPVANFKQKKDVQRLQKSYTVHVCSQINNPFRQYIQNTLTKKPSIENITLKNSQTLNKVCTDQCNSFLNLLQRLKNTKLSFLPYSVQLKFTRLIQIYQHLLSKKPSSELQPAYKPQVQMSDDDMMSTLVLCQKESQLCRCCEAFLRRLVRLAKSYKESAIYLPDILLLWKRVEQQASQSRS